MPRITHRNIAKGLCPPARIPSKLTITLSIVTIQLCGFSKDVPPGRNMILPIGSTATLSRAAAPETAEMLYLRGVACAEGNGTPKDESKAAELYRQAAEQGYAPAQYDLALLYDEGRGIAQNLAEAAKWYRAAAEQGDAEAQNNLGRVYALGRGLPEDAGRAAYWYRKAAEQGNVEGQNNLANSYREGRGVTRDLTNAFELYRRAAMSGYAVAQSNLGLMYANGSGTERDYCLAYAWLALAATKLPASQKLLEQVQSKMTSEEIGHGKRTKDDLQAQLRPSNDGVPKR